MEFIKLSENFTVSRLVAGFMRLLEWQMNTTALERFINQLIDIGITTFDHADIYGDYECETEFGKVLLRNKQLRLSIQLVTKCGIRLLSDKFPERKIKSYDTSFEHIINSAEQSLKNLNTDYIDLFLLHRPDPLMNYEEIGTAFKELERSGKVRYFGVSNFNSIQFEALNDHFDGKLVTNQVEFSPYCLEHFDNGNIDFFMKEKINPMAWCPLAGGKLLENPEDEKSNRLVHILREIAWELNTGISQVIFAWILHHPVKFIPVLGSGKLGRIKDAVKALDIKLNSEQWYQIYNASRGYELP